jgi:hypothetical protein
MDAGLIMLLLLLGLVGVFGVYFGLVYLFGKKEKALSIMSKLSGMEAKNVPSYRIKFSGIVLLFIGFICILASYAFISGDSGALDLLGTVTRPFTLLTK